MEDAPNDRRAPGRAATRGPAVRSALGSRRTARGTVVSGTLAAAAALLAHGGRELRAQRVVHVPAERPTIAAALRGAEAGDTVVVAPGTYHETLVWPDVGELRLLAPAGPGHTVVDARGRGRVLAFVEPGRVGPESLVEGFTFTGGLVRGGDVRGAGVLVVDASPTLRGNRIVGNRCLAEGPAGSAAGAGLYVASGTPRLEANLVRDNVCAGAGPAVTCLGAGACFAGGGGVVARNRILGNRIVAPSGTAFGAGVHVAGPARVELRDNLVVENWSHAGPRSGGAGVSLEGHGRLVGNTVANNHLLCGVRPDPTAGGAVWISGRGAVVVNNVVADNSPAGLFLDPDPATRPAAAHHNCVWNNGAAGHGGSGRGDYVNTSPDVTDLGLDPRFSAPGRYDPAPGSPCIDAGADAEARGGSALDGTPRRVDGDLDGGGARVDVGCHELSPVELRILGRVRRGATTVALAVGTPNGIAGLDPTARWQVAWILSAADTPGWRLDARFGGFAWARDTRVLGVGEPGEVFTVVLPRGGGHGRVAPRMHVQALVLDPAGARGAFTNLVSFRP